MIVNFCTGIDVKIFPSYRILETIVRVSIAFARLMFSNVVTVEIAKAAISFLKDMYVEFDKNVKIVEDPHKTTCRMICEFLMANPDVVFDFKDCINYADDTNLDVQSYLGSKTPIDPNSAKYRDVADKFRLNLVGPISMHKVYFKFYPLV